MLQQWYLRLIDPLPSICEMVWWIVVLDAIWAMEQGRKRRWSFFMRLLGRGLPYNRLFPKLPPLSGLPWHEFAR
jgi:hypothetical protein